MLWFGAFVLWRSMLLFSVCVVVVLIVLVMSCVLVFMCWVVILYLFGWLVVGGVLFGCWCCCYDVYNV